MKKGSIPTVAVVTARYLSAYHNDVTMGAVAAAKEYNFNIIGLPGGPLNTPAFNLKKNSILYNLLDPGFFDGLIITIGSLSRFVSEAEYSEFLKPYAHLPIVSVGSSYRDFPCVKPDYYGGMLSLMEHLIADHGCRRIILIRGPREHPSSEERTQVYRAALEKHGIPVNEQYIYYTAMMHHDVPAVVHKILKVDELDFDAIVTLNDTSGLRVIDELRNYGIAVPGQVKVAGFQGIVKGSFSQPSLTTVNESSYALGKAAGRMMSALLRGNKVDRLQELPCDLVIRESCGSLDFEPDKFEKSFVYNSTVNANDFIGTNQIPPLISGTAGEREEEEYRNVVKIIKAIHEQSPSAEECYRGIVNLLRYHKNKFLLFTKYQLKELFGLFRQLGFFIVRDDGFMAIINLLSEVLGVKNLYVVLSEENRPPFKYCYLLNGFKDGQFIDFKDHFERFHISQILPAGFLPEKFYLALQPLYFQDEILGYMIIDFTVQEGSIYESLMTLLSNYIKNKIQNLELRSAEQKLNFFINPAIILSTMSEAIFLLDKGLSIIYLNQAAKTLLGLENTNLAGKNIKAIFDKKHENFEIINETNSLRNVRLLEINIVDTNRQLIPVSLSASHLYDENTNIIGVVCTARDMRQTKKIEQEKKLLEEQIFQSQKMEAIGQLAGGIGHDFNNILGSILGAAELMKIQVSDANSIFHSYIDIIISASNRAAGLITKLLAFARKGKYQVVLVDLNQVIGNVVKLLDHSLDKRIVIKRERLYAEATVLGDPTQLENAVLNLALNARDAMPDGGTLEFSTAMADSANSSLPELVAGRYVLLRVRDDGMGMDKAVQAKIFEPFFTTKPIGKGTGLGLASVYGTVSNHQGRIEVESAPGRGACFSIYLPYIKQQADRKNKKPLKFKRQSGTILFVDDEELIRTVGAESLRAFGYDVVLCKNGSEAMAYYKKHPTSTDIVMLDLMMPKMSGQDCLRRMKAINPAQRAIIMSGHSVEKEPHELNDFKDVDYIQKPFDLQRLYTVLQKTIKD